MFPGSTPLGYAPGTHGFTFPVTRRRGGHLAICGGEKLQFGNAFFKSASPAFVTRVPPKVSDRSWVNPFKSASPASVILVLVRFSV